MVLKFRPKDWFVFIIMMLLLTNLTILLNIAFLRPIFGFFFLTLIPGLLVLQILKINKIRSIEKIILSVGLSIAFLMFFGLLINSSLLSFGYVRPLSTISLLISFNITFIILAIIGYKINKTPIFSLPNINLIRSEKVFLIIPILFPALSIFGTHIMNTTNDNIILMFFLFLIPIHITFVCFFNHKFPKRLYPVVIFLISISLLLLLSLRSNYIIGVDTHYEYYLFQTTLDNLYWHALTVGNALDACLSISLLPTIYQSILNIPSEFLFKILYSLIYSISPLVIYVISKKYVEEGYAFLASCFFMFQVSFLTTTANARTNIAILFFALAMMVLFNDKIEPLKKRILFIVFIASCTVSHYSTTYIFFFILLGSFLGIEILSKKYIFKKVISLKMVLLFFAFIFFWYSQIIETAFNVGVGFIKNTLNSLNRVFVEESRGGCMQAMLGKDIMQKGIPHKIHFVFTWLTFAFIGIGIITLIRRYKKMSFSELNFKKSDFLKDKFEVRYFVITLACAGLLATTVLVPFFSLGYNLDRLYAIGITILSVFFVIGGMIIAKYSDQSSATYGGKKLMKNASQVRAYLIILLVLIPYFLCVTGVTYQVFGVPRSMILNSEGEQQLDRIYVHDQESYGAKWLGSYAEKRQRIYADFYGGRWLISQGGIMPSLINFQWFSNPVMIDGYIYLRYQNIVNSRLVDAHNKIYNLTDYQDLFIKKNKIYDSGYSKVYR